MTTKLTTIFSQVEDPRRDITKLHQLNDILLIAILAVICGAETWKDIETFAISKVDFLSTFLELCACLACSVMHSIQGTKLETYKK